MNYLYLVEHGETVFVHNLRGLGYIRPIREPKLYNDAITGYEGAVLFINQPSESLEKAILANERVYVRTKEEARAMFLTSLTPLENDELLVELRA